MHKYKRLQISMIINTLTTHTHIRKKAKFLAAVKCGYVCCVLVY